MDNKLLIGGTIVMSLLGGFIINETRKHLKRDEGLVNLICDENDKLRDELSHELSNRI